MFKSIKKKYKKIIFFCHSLKKRTLSTFKMILLDYNKLKNFILFFFGVFVIFTIILVFKDNVNFFNLFDITILTSFLTICICNLLTGFISSYIKSKKEDSIKLTNDYNLLNKKYNRSQLYKFNKNGVTFPIIILAFRNKNSTFNLSFEKQLSNKYELPSMISEYSSYIFKAHSSSDIYNRINVRVDDIIVDNNNNIKLLYSDTTYYNSLLTNRSMDYIWPNGRTTREMYEPGPFLNSLKNSKMSNHLGFNGFIETTDNKFIFVFRNSNLSVGKNTISPSIAASLKVEYCYDDNQLLNSHGLSCAIKKEIYNELKLDIPEDNLIKNIFAFYRDVQEGGKPQFLFYYKLQDITEDIFLQNFKRSFSYKTGTQTDIDGIDFHLYSFEDLQNCKINPGLLSIGIPTDHFNITPSAAASICLLINFLENK